LVKTISWNTDPVAAPVVPGSARRSELAHPDPAPIPPVPLAVAEGDAEDAAGADGLADEATAVGITTVAVADADVGAGVGGGGVDDAGDEVHPASSAAPVATVPAHPSVRFPNLIEHHLISSFHLVKTLSD
jgi:hypothetical protein